MKEIRQIIELYNTLKAERVPSALAVVVDVARSSYRRIGARLLVANDGRYVGGISGGCLEGDALKRAKQAIQLERPSKHTYDTTDGEDATIGIGLGCEGRVDVAFFPLDYHNELNEIELLARLVTNREPILLIRHLNPDYEREPNAGSPIIFHASDSPQTQYFSFCPHHITQICDVAKNTLSQGRSGVENIRGERGYPHQVLFEVLHPRIRLIVTGYNYDIPATLKAANLLDWETCVVAPVRKLNKVITSFTDEYVDYSAVGKVKIDAATAVALMSHDYDWDRRMVQHFLPQKPIYLGMLGPKKRMLKIAASLPEMDLVGYPNLYAPVGLDIGAETPEEIAAALIAEIVMAFRKRDGGPLRDRVEKIYPE